MDVVKFVHRVRFGAAVDLLKNNSPDVFDSIVKQLSDKAANTEDMNRISELKALKNLRPCVDTEDMFRIDGRLENAALAVDAKHPLILPGMRALTRLVVFYEHVKAGHAGPSYTLIKTTQKLWIVHGIACVKRFLNDCSICARRKTTSIRQLMAELSTWRVTAANKPFKFCGVDYCGPFFFRQAWSKCKAWGYFLLVCAPVAFTLNW